MAMGDILDWFFTSNVTIRNYLRTLLVDLWLLNEAYPEDIRIPLDAAGKSFVKGWQEKLKTAMSPLMRQISGMDLEPSYQNLQARLMAAAESGKSFLTGEMRSAMRKVVTDVKKYDEMIEARGARTRGVAIFGFVAGLGAYGLYKVRQEHRARMAGRAAPGAKKKFRPPPMQTGPKT